MKALKWLAAGATFGIISNVVHGIVNGAIFKDWYAGYEYLYRVFDTAMMSKLTLLSVIMGLVFSFLYLVFYEGIPGGSPAKKGFLFGLLLWLPWSVDSFFQYVMRPGPFQIPCLIAGMILMPLGGMFIGLIYGKSLEKD